MTSRKVALRGALALIFATGFTAAGPFPEPAAAAVVYCKSVGVPKGCVARPTPVVVYCTAAGVPVGCVARRPARVVHCTAPGVPVGCRAGTPMNRGGPVNRVGRR